VNNTNLNNNYVNNTYVNNTYVNNTYENDNYGGVYLNSPQGIGTILSVSLIVGSCISLLPYAFNVIKTRVLEPKKRRKLGDLDS
jgi:hypothetical protein